MTEMRHALGKLIWDTSRADESSISYIGANIIADAILAKFNVQVLPEPDPEREEYEAYKAVNRGRLQAHAVQRIIDRALDPEMED